MTTSISGQAAQLANCFVLTRLGVLRSKGRVTHSPADGALGKVLSPGGPYCVPDLRALSKMAKKASILAIVPFISRQPDAGNTGNAILAKELEV